LYGTHGKYCSGGFPQYRSLSGVVDQEGDEWKEIVNV
jgi:hypothetical protein